MSGPQVIADQVAGDDAVGVAGDAEIGDLAEAQDAAIAPQQAEAESHRDVEEVVGDVAGVELAER